MAKVLATIAGTALVPGVSRNGRLYTREAIARAVHRAQGQLADGKILTVLTHHDAGDDSERIIGRITGMTLEGGGSAKFTAELADTPHARTIAGLIDNTSGQPFLNGMSIRGAWVGKVRRERGPAGTAVETADDLEFLGIDPTHKPGVDAAGVDAFAWAKDGATETSERVLITESVQEAHVTAITEETTPADRIGDETHALSESILAGVRAVLAASPDVEEADGTPAMSQRDSGLSGGGRKWADPGYQPDHKQRYDITSKAKAVAAWKFINQKAMAAKYTGPQLKKIKSRIVAALKSFGVTPAEEGWVIEPAFEVTEAVAEMLGDASCAGSYSLSATNGPTTVTVCSYGLDPADLRPVLAKACEGAGLALAALDPDMDADIDVPGADAEDTDGDSNQMDGDDGTAGLARRLAAAIRGETTEPLEDLIAEARAQRDGGPAVTEAAPTESPAATPDAASQGTEAPAVSETTTTQETAAGATTAAPSFTQADLQAAVAQALADDKAARKARKAARGKTPESAPQAAVTETAAPDLDKLVADRVAAALAEQGLTETTEQKIDRLVAEGVTRAKQELAASGSAPGRKGLVAEHTGSRADDGIPENFPMKDGRMIPMEQWTEDQRRAVGATLQTHVLGDRAVF